MLYYNCRRNKHESEVKKMTLSRFLGKKLLQPKTKKVFRSTMKLYNGHGEWKVVKNVIVSGQMSNGRKTFEFEGYDKDCIYMMFKDKFNGEYLTAI